MDELIARLANEQYGVVARRQLAALGASPDHIRGRLNRGALRRLRPGVYAVGHTALTRRSRWMAAILAAGPGAVLSHRSAGAFYEICREGRRIEIIVARKSRPHRCTRLENDEHELRDGLPITTPARTLFDLAAVLPPERLEHAFNQAEYHRLTSPVPLADLLTRHARRPGAATLRTLLAQRSRLRTDTEMEADFLSFLDENHLPRPTHTQHPNGGTRPDAVYVPQRIIVELDGGSHLTYRAFHADRARDRANLVDNWRTIRVTNLHLDVAEERRALARDLHALLETESGSHSA